jgi:Cu-processing system permease protein
MFKILKYSFFDLVRSRWIYIYFIFFLATTSGLLYLSSDLSKAIVSLMNIVVILCPLVATLFGAMHYYNSREFVELLLALPLPRRNIFLGKYLGLALSLSASFLVGTLIPFLVFGLAVSAQVWDYGILLLAGVLLTFIFTGLAFLLTMLNDNPIKGFGAALVLWLFMAVVYDGLFLLTLLLFGNYPLDTYSLAATFFNPVDLSRVLVMLKLDLSSMMGYTGAVFNKFLGTGKGMLIAAIAMVVWIAVPLMLYLRKAGRKDF